MKRWVTAIWQCFSIGLLLVATAVPHLHDCGPRLLCERDQEEKQEKEEKNRTGEEELAKEAVVHAVRGLFLGLYRRPSLATSPHPSTPHSRAALWQGQICLADAMRGARGLFNGCGATLLR